MPFFDSFDPSGGQQSFFAPEGGAQGPPQAPPQAPAAPAAPFTGGASRGADPGAAGGDTNNPYGSLMTPGKTPEAAPMQWSGNPSGAPVHGYSGQDEPTSLAENQSPNLGGSTGLGTAPINRSASIRPTAAERYNNPGDVSLPITGWGGGGEIVGIKGQPGYGKFSSPQEGFDAMVTQLGHRIGQGHNTISSLNSVYAEDPRWAHGVSAYSGIGANEPLDANNPQQMAQLAQGVVKQETGKTPQQLGVGQGINLRATQGIGGGPAARAGHERAGKEWAARERDVGPIRESIEKDLSTPRPTFEQWAQQNHMPSRPPNYEEWRTQHNNSILQGKGPAFAIAAGAMMILGAAFGRKGASSRIVGLQGMAGFVNGLSSGNREAAAKGLAQTKEGFQEMQRLFEDSRQAYNDAMTAKDKNIDQKYQIMALEAAKHGDKQAYDAAQQKRLEGIDKLNIQREKAMLDVQKKLFDMEKMLKDIEWRHEDADKKENETALTHANHDRDEAYKGLGKSEEELRKFNAQIGEKDPETKARLEGFRQAMQQRVHEADAKVKAAEQRMSGGSTQDAGTAPQQPASQGAPPPEAISDLKNNPTTQMKQHFDEIFGQGAADKALGGGDGGAQSAEPAFDAKEAPDEAYSTSGY